MNETITGEAVQLLDADELAAVISALDQYGIPGLFLAAFLSNLIPGFPALYLALVATYATIVGDPAKNILAIVAAGVGAGLGKLVLFMISGSIAKRSKWFRAKRESAQWFIRKVGKSILITVFLFAALPLPDDIVYIPLGAAGYQAIPFFIAVILGKIVLTAIFVFLGAAWREILLNYGQGLSLEAVILATVAAGLVFSYVVLSMDWKRVYEAYESRGVVYAFFYMIYEFFRTLFRPLQVIAAKGSNNAEKVSKPR